MLQFCCRNDEGFKGRMMFHRCACEGYAPCTLFAGLIGLAVLASTLPAARAQESVRTVPAPKSDTGADSVTLAHPVVLEVRSSNGSLKETVQKGQQLTWRRYDRSHEPKFHVSDIAVAFLRSEPTGEVKITFSAKVSSSGYSTVEVVRLNLMVRTKGGASIYFWSPVITVKCGDKNQPVVPLTDQVPKDIAANVFANVGSVEISEHRGPDFPRVKVRRCDGLEEHQAALAKQL